MSCMMRVGGQSGAAMLMVMSSAWAGPPHIAEPTSATAPASSAALPFVMSLMLVSLTRSTRKPRRCLPSIVSAGRSGGRAASYATMVPESLRKSRVSAPASAMRTLSPAV